MAEYHVGCGAFGIYAGTLEPRNKNLGRNKSDVTDEVMCAAAQYLILNDQMFRFKYKDKQYVMRVEEDGQ